MHVILGVESIWTVNYDDLVKYKKCARYDENREKFILKYNVGCSTSTDII